MFPRRGEGGREAFITFTLTSLSAFVDRRLVASISLAHVPFLYATLHELLATPVQTKVGHPHGYTITAARRGVGALSIVDVLWPFLCQP